MFTGIIEETGLVRSIKKSSSSWQVEISARACLAGLAPGGSININGACHTAVRLTENSFFADVTPETRRASTMGDLKVNDPVNLEKPLTLAKPLGGHLVQGHVDAVGKIKTVKKEGNSSVITVSFPPLYRKYVAVKGSVCIDGISLTIASCSRDSLTVSIIPATLKTTTLQQKKPGHAVNLEFDIIAKYVESLAACGGGRNDKGSPAADDFKARGFYV